MKIRNYFCRSRGHETQTSIPASGFNSIRAFSRRLLLGFGFIAALSLLYAQEATPVESGSDSLTAIENEDVSGLSDMGVLIKALELIPSEPASELPSPMETHGFYSVQHPEWPLLPGDVLGLNFWPLQNGIFAIDDRTVSYSQPVKSTATAKTAGGMEAMVDLNPGDGDTNDDGGGGYSPMISLNNDYGTNLWIARWSMAAGTVTGIASNTVADVEYDLMTNSDLTTTNWNATGMVIYGSETTNWTALPLMPVNLTGNLFFRLRSDISSDGSGLPDWWELEYFGHTGIDPYADPDGDGWNNLQEFQNGTSPTAFNTPPAPQGLTVSYNANNNTAAVNWLPAAGNVTGYTVEEIYQPFSSTPQTNYFSVSGTSFTNNVASDEPDPWQQGNIPTTFTVTSNYAGGNSTASASAPLETSTFSGVIVPGAQGIPQLLVSALPANAAAVRLTEISFDNLDYHAPAFVTNFDVPVSSFTNNVSALPNVKTTGVGQYDDEQYYWAGQTVSADGSLGANTHLGGVFLDSANNDYQTNWMVPPFYDGRVQLKQNLIFQLRAAGAYAPFQYTIVSNGYYMGIFTNPTNYVYAGFYDSEIFGNNSADYSQTLNPIRPFLDNNFYRNFVFTLADVDDTGNLATGANLDDHATLDEPVEYQFQGDQTALLSGGSSRWLLYDASAEGGDDDVVSAGIVNEVSDESGYGTLYLTNNARNWYGLPYVSVNVAYAKYDDNYNYLGIATNVIDAGGSATFTGNDFYTVFGNNSAIYPETAQPQFQTVEYDFWQPYSVNIYASYPDIYSLPGNPYFSPANAGQNLFITSVGGSMTIAGYAKLSVQNGYSGVYGYLGQYFDKAYQMTNGVVTTNSAGVLSPYGNFFATQPGAAALVTMPDVDTGQRGTNIVYAISLVLDKNHDWKMDSYFAGQDATSVNSPMVFWIDGNYDRWAYDSEDKTNYMDDVKIGDCLYTPNHDTPDYNYRDAYGNRVIPCTRDLQDFTRLWVAGIDTNLIAKLPAGSTVTLNWGDVGSPNSANPTIDLFAAADADGGIGYQTNETTAANQIDPTQSPYLGRLGPGQSIQLNASTFANNWAGNHFIWCGVSNGTGGLNLTIADGNGNVLAQSTSYIQIEDIKLMYERWTLGDMPTIAPKTNAILASEDLPPFTSSFQYTPPQDTSTPYILLVHGWNEETWNKDRWAETAFKQLYWQGYQGRFGEFRWPTDYGFAGWQTIATNLTEKDNFDSSEYQAWQSAQGLLNKLNDLNAEYPGHVYMLAHSMGNVVAGEALRRATTQVVNTYVASQAAVSAHTYDDTVPDYSFFYPPWSASADTPNIYGNWFAGNYGGGAGMVVSFYNTNDYALQRSVWQRDELLKPDQDVLEGSTTWYYGYDGSVSDPSPWNNFYKQTFGGGTVFDFNIVTSLNNRYEVMAYDAQSWTTALGATPGVGNVGGNIYLGRTTVPRIWQPDPTGNSYTEHFYHSAQFRGDFWQMQGYWSELLGSEAFNLK